MGAGAYFDGNKFFRETDDSRAQTRADLFEKIVSRLKTNGAEIREDGESPLYRETFNGQEIEIGTRRVIECEMGGFDWQITRDTEERHIVGREVEELDQPMIKIMLKKRPIDANNWEIVDLEDMNL